MKDSNTHTRGLAGTIVLMRRVKGLSQRQLGERTGIHPQRVWRIEAGVQTPGPDEFARITKALGLDEADDASPKARRRARAGRPASTTPDSTPQ